MTSSHALHVTENKSVDKLALGGLNTVRVFVDNDYTYGYWVPERELFDALDASQQQVYLQGPEARLQVSKAVAQHAIDIGLTPFAKTQLA